MNLAPKSADISETKAGTTFVEAIIALAIFAVFTTGACKLLISHRQTLDMARDHYTAGNLAKNRLELVRTFEFDQISDMGEDGIPVDGNGIPTPGGNFMRITTVNVLSSNLYELAVSVKIKNRKTLTYGPAEEVINTYVAKHL